jgi:hypothetical protein
MDNSKDMGARLLTSMQPPVPKWLSLGVRGIMLLILILIGHWVSAFLGGVALSPRETGAGANDTGQLFNWHPVLMTLAFAVFMAEAVLTYQAPLLSWLTRYACLYIIDACVHVHAHTSACTSMPLAFVVFNNC